MWMIVHTQSKCKCNSYAKYYHSSQVCCIIFEFGCFFLRDKIGIYSFKKAKLVIKKTIIQNEPMTVTDPKMNATSVTISCEFFLQTAESSSVMTWIRTNDVKEYLK